MRGQFMAYPPVPLDGRDPKTGLAPDEYTFRCGDDWLDALECLLHEQKSACCAIIEAYWASRGSTIIVDPDALRPADSYTPGQRCVIYKYTTKTPAPLPVPAAP